MKKNLTFVEKLKLFLLPDFFTSDEYNCFLHLNKIFVQLSAYF